MEKLNAEVLGLREALVSKEKELVDLKGSRSAENDSLRE